MGGKFKDVENVMMLQAKLWQTQGERKKKVDAL
jgi:hypothetical protein